MYTNIRSINNKLNEISTYLSLHTPKLIFLVETWLTPETPNTLLNWPNYTIYRNDRKKSGGGLLIAVHKSIASEQIEIVSESELLAVYLRWKNNKNFKLILAYNPHLGNTENLSKLLNTISTLINNEHKYIIMGDFNLAKFNWVDYSKNNNKPFKLVNEFLIENAPIYQAIEFATRNENILDIILTSNQTFLKNISPAPPIGKSDHVCVIGTLNIAPFTNENYSFERQNFCKMDKNSIYKILLSHKHGFQGANNARTAISSFNTLTNYLVRNFVPTEKFYKYKTEILPDRIYKIYKSFSKSYRKWKYTRNNFYYKKYKSLKNLYSNFLKNRRLKFESKLISSKNYSKFFKFFRSKTKSMHLENTAFIVNGSTVVDERTISDLFNNYFASVYNIPTNSPFPYQISTNDRIIISSNLIRDSINQIKNSKGTGSDGIPMSFWFDLSENFTPILYQLFNYIANEGIWPEEWKTSILTPLFKNKGKRTEINNYRPISSLCTISRIFEKCIHTLLSTKLEQTISLKQHGFMKNRSPHTNLLNFYHMLYKQLDAKLPIDVITIDMTKAFDKVNHSLLLSKLKAYGVSPKFLNLLNGFLVGRRQRMSYHGNLSACAPVHSGLPQGSVLSPLLFAIYINDLLDKTYSNHLIAYADDIKLGGPPGDSLQSDLAVLSDWMIENIMSVNDEKCELIHFGKNNPRKSYYYQNSKISVANEIRDLGVIIDSCLNFQSHSHAVYVKCVRLINMIFKIFIAKTQEPYVKAFNAYVFPIISYCSYLYFKRSAANVRETESIQRLFTKKLFHRIYGNKPRPNYQVRLSLFSMRSIGHNLAIADLCLLYKIIAQSIHIEGFDLKLSTRSKYRIVLSPLNSSLYRTSFFHTSCMCWNGLAKKFQSLPTSLIAFRSMVKRLYLE